MAATKSIEKVKSVKFPLRRRTITPSTLMVLAVLVLILSLTSSANALGGYRAIPDLSDGRIPFYDRRNHNRLPHRLFPTIPPSPSTNNNDNLVIPPPNVCGVIGHSRVRRVINGIRAERCQYPWMVLLIRGHNPWDTCGASLISDRHIITAAHCFGMIQVEPVIIVGEYDKNEIRPSSEIRITKFNITIHPKFDDVHYVNDIAILTLNTPIDLSKYDCLRPICLPDENEVLPVGTVCRVLGWGSVQKDNIAGIAPQTSNVLQETTIKVVRSALCSRTWGKKYHPDVQICAGDMAGLTDSCLGDSGGPLMCASKKNKDVYYLHGIVSLGSIQCAEPNVPALYSKVGKYKSWIETMMKK